MSFTQKIILVVIALVIGGGIWVKWLKPWRDGKKMLKELDMFCKIDYPASDESVQPGEIPYRTGKIFIVIPSYEANMASLSRTKIMNPAKIASHWYRLEPSIRATKPQNVDTLIQVFFDTKGVATYWSDGGTGTGFGGTVVNRDVILKVFDMNKKILIGVHMMAGIKATPDMVTSDELRELSNASTYYDLLGFVKSMPVR